MAKRLLPPDWHVTKDNGDPATDAVLTFKLGGTSTNTPIWYDPGLTTGDTAVVNCDSTGYPASAGDDISIWGEDDVTYDVVVSATGYNGGASKTIQNLVVADTVVTDNTVSEVALGNAFDNGGFDAWSGGTSFSNLSGDNDGDETADGWFFTQPSAASNAVSQQAGFAVGTDPVGQRYSIRFGRPVSSSSTNELRLWALIKPEIAYRLRGKSVTLRFSAKAGANYSASGGALGVRLATGTTESEDGDLIDSGGWAGQANPVDTLQTISTTAARYEFTVTLGTTIKEIGIEFSYTGVDTAGAADNVTIQDVELVDSTASSDYPARPEALEFFISKLSTLGRKFVAFPLADPNADRIVFWDDSADAMQFLSLGTGISISGTTMSLAATLVDVAGLAVTSGNFIVGNGTNFVAQSGATARTSLGVGSGDSPTFTNLSLTGVAKLADGSAANPAYTFTSQLTTGMYFVANNLAFATGGVLRFFTNNSSLQSQLPIWGSAGTAVAPSICPSSGDTNTGFYFIGADNMGLALGGALEVDFSQTRALFTHDIVLPSAAAPSSIYSVGYRGSPVVSGNSAYAFPLADAGSTIYHDEAGTRTYTIPANASVAHQIGTIFVISNTGNSGAAGTITLAITTDTLRRADGTSGTGSRTIAANQKCCIEKVAATIWEISGGFT